MFLRMSFCNIQRVFPDRITNELELYLRVTTYVFNWITVLPNPRFRRLIRLLLTSAPRLSSLTATSLLLTYLPRNVLEIGRLCEKLSISCQFRGILNFFNVNEQINHKLIGLRRHIEPSKSFESDYPQLPEVGQSIVFPPIWVIFGLFDT